MKKALFVGHRDMFFGAESVMFRIIKILAAENSVKPIVVLPKSDHNGFRKALKEANYSDPIMLPFKLVSAGFFKSLLCICWSFYSVVFLVLYCKRKKIDIICSNTSVNIIGALAAFLAGKQHIWYFHEQPTGGSFKWISPKLFPLYRFLISRRSSKVIFISNIQKSKWETEFAMKINNSEVVYTPPVEVEQLPPANKEDFSFGFLGSWTPSKNISMLIACFSDLRQKYPTSSARLVIMGEGILKDEIEKDIKDLDLTNYVELLSHSREVAGFFAKIDVFVLPSLFESWGLSALEALSLKKFVILTENTGLTEILINNHDCVFISPVNSQQLFNAMEKAMHNEEFRNDVATNGLHKLKSLKLAEVFHDSIYKIFC